MFITEVVTAIENLIKDGQITGITGLVKDKCKLTGIYEARTIEITLSLYHNIHSALSGYKASIDVNLTFAGFNLLKTSVRNDEERKALLEAWEKAEEAYKALQAEESKAAWDILNLG